MRERQSSFCYRPLAGIIFIFTTVITHAADESLSELVVSGTPQASAGSLNLEKISDTGSRLGLSQQNIPASVEIISRDLLDIRGDHSTLDAVTRATGITSSAAPGNGSTALTARGFNGHGSVMQLYDGTRFFIGAGTLTFPVDTWTLERIEVLRGPASVTHGLGAIGAAINYVPKQPSLKQREHEAFVSAASYNTWRTAFGSGGPIAGDWYYRVDLSRTASAGYIDRADSERYALASSLLYKPSEYFSATLSFDGGDVDSAGYWGTPLINGRVDSRTRRKNYNIRDDIINYEDYWPRLDIDWRLNEHVSFSNETYYLVSNRHWDNLENYTHNPATGLIDRTSYIQILHDQEQLGNRFETTLDGQLWGHDNRLVVGLDINRIDFKHTNNDFSGSAPVGVNPFDFDPGTSADLVGTQPLRPDFRTTTYQWAVFAEYLFAVTEQFKVIGGLRHDTIDYELEDLRGNDNVEESYHPTDWRVGLVYEITPSLTVYGQTSTGTDPIGGAILTTSASETEFELTSGRQYEAGLKQVFWNGRGEWTLALYQIEKENLRSRDPINPGVIRQVGKQSSKGIELTAGIRPLERLAIHANLAVLSAEFDDFTENVGGSAVSRAGNTPTNVPEQTANLWATYFINPQWRVGGGLRYVGQRYADTANTQRLASYTTADFFAAWQPVASSEVALRLRNAFDRDYVIAPNYGGTQVLLGDPRTIELALSTRF